MEIVVRPRNFKLQADIESHIRSRVERLPRHLDNVESAEVILTQAPTHQTASRLHYRAQLTVHTRTNNLIRTEVANPELLTAVDQALARLMRQMERVKGRYDRKRKGAVGLGKMSADVVDAATTRTEELASADEGAARASALASSWNADATDGELGDIVKVKRFSVQPMYPEEAIEQMELLGHNFYVFWNAGEERMNVLYRRHDGNYGLLQPDLH